MTSTMSKIFIDTNILVYILDKKSKLKHKTCKELLRSFKPSSNQKAVISTQVLQEFYIVATSKLKAPLVLVKSMLKSLEAFEIINIDYFLIQEAIDCHLLNQISFWDALIVSAAKSANCDTVWTEDLNHGQIIQGVKIINPLKS